MSTLVLDMFLNIVDTFLRQKYVIHLRFTRGCPATSNLTFLALGVFNILKLSFMS